MEPQSSTAESTPSARGPLAAGPSDFCMEWNAENQLTRVLQNAAEVARYKYDPLGRRVERVAGGTTTLWAHDAEDILKETVGGSAVRYVHGLGIDEPLAQEDGSGVLSHIHADGLWSVVRTSSAAGAVINSRRYDAFGNLELGTSNGHAFTGREWDVAVGLAYYRARYYEPTRGRFVTEDPLQWKAGNNFYAYVQGNPTSLMDPFGLAVVTVTPQGPGPCSGAMHTTGLLLNMRTAGVVNDKIAHCLSHCYLTKGCGAGGQLISNVLGSGKEWLDEMRGVAGRMTCLMGSCPPKFFDPGNFYDLGDMDANAQGRSCPANVSCWDNCKDADKILTRPRFH